MATWGLEPLCFGRIVEKRFQEIKHKSQRNQKKQYGALSSLALTRACILPPLPIEAAAILNFLKWSQYELSAKTKYWYKIPIPNINSDAKNTEITKYQIS